LCCETDAVAAAAPLGRVAEMKMLDKTQQSEFRTQMRSRKIVTCSALPKGVRPVLTLLYAMAGRQALVSKAASQACSL